MGKTAENTFLKICARQTRLSFCWEGRERETASHDYKFLFCFQAVKQFWLRSEKNQRGRNFFLLRCKLASLSFLLLSNVNKGDSEAYVEKPTNEPNFTDVWKLTRNQLKRPFRKNWPNSSKKECRGRGSSVGRASFQRSLNEVQLSDWRGFKSHLWHKVVWKKS